MKIAALFPGQGSQYVGMGKDFYFDKNRVLQRDLYKKSIAASGKSLPKLSILGPEEELNKTENTQPSLAATSLIMYQTFSDELLGKPYAVTGHSLGFISSLYAAEVLSFEDTIALATARGAFMQHEVPDGEYGMVAIMGLPKKNIKDFESDINPLNVYVANDNSNNQITISGEKSGLEPAIIKATEKYGAKNAVILSNISTPFHTPYMENAAHGLEEYLDCLEFKNPVCKVISNVSAKPLSFSHEIKKDIPKQIYSKLKWTDSMKNLAKNNIDHYVSFGPGNVLQNLMKRIDKNAKFHSVNSIESLEKTLTKIKKK